MVTGLPLQKLFLARRDGPFQPDHHLVVFRLMTALRAQVGHRDSCCLCPKAAIALIWRDDVRAPKAVISGWPAAILVGVLRAVLTASLWSLIKAR